MLIVVLFNLKPDASREDYENWAKTTDIPNVNALGSVHGFSVVKTTGLLGKDDPAPYEYVELLHVADMELFGEEVATDTMRRVAGEFQAFADNPTFMMTEPL
jgi:hypothetical protein